MNPKRKVLGLELRWWFAGVALAIIAGLWWRHHQQTAPTHPGYATDTKGDIPPLKRQSLSRHHTHPAQKKQV